MEDVFEGAFKLLFRGLFLVLRLLAQILFEVIVEIVCYWTTRLLAPVFTFGSVSVDDLSGPPARFNWLGLRRNSDGRVRLSPNAAAAYGIVFWIAVMIVSAAWFGASPTEPPQPSSFAITSSEIS